MYLSYPFTQLLEILEVLYKSDNSKLLQKVYLVSQDAFEIFGSVFTESELMKNNYFLCHLQYNASQWNLRIVS